MKYLIYTILLLILVTCSFIIGASLAYMMDVLEAKAPDMWAKERSELTAKPNYGYQDPISPQTTIEPKELYKLEEL